MDLQFKAADGSKRYKITKIYVPEGGSFQAGAPLLKAESGKMNTVVKAEQAGTLKKLLVKEGQEIGSGEIFAQAEYAAGTSAAGGQRGTVGSSSAASQRDAAKATPNPALSLFGKKEELSCEIAVVGAGPGGYEAAIYAAKQGKDVIHIEKSKVGGT